MAYAICGQHGAQPAELVTQNVIDIIRDHTKHHAQKVIPFTLVYEELEYPGYGTEEDRVILERLGGVWALPQTCRFTDEQAMERALGLLTAVCAKCLAEIT